MPIGGGNIMYPSAAYAPITLYWDTNGTSIGATNSTTATGTWGTNNFWSTDPAGLVATRPWIPGGDAVFSAGSNATGVYTVTVSGLQPVRNITVRNGTITFTTGTLQIAPSAQWYNETSNLVSVTAGIRYTNTLTLKSGLWGITSAASVGTAGVTLDGNGVWVLSGHANSFGTGILTLKNGKLSSDSGAARAFTSGLLISGSITLGDLTNTGALSFGPSQSITNSLAITALSNVTFGANMTWDGNAITFRGPGVVTQTSTIPAASHTGAITIGDGTTFSGNSVGGIVSVGSQNNLGSGSVAVNYGGTLTVSASFDPAQAVVVNSGGAFGSGFNLANSTVTMNSGASFAGANNNFQGTIPSAGALLATAAVTAKTLPNSGAFSGTMAFGGTAGLTIDGPSAMTLGGSAKTLAFNASAVTTLADGLALNANLTLAGSGNTGLTGLVPTGAAGVLGTVSGNYAVTVNMAPTGAVSLTDHATTKLTTLTVNSGTAIVSTDLGSNTAQLNGGGIRMGTAISSAINVGANGGVLETASALSYTGNLTATAGAPNLVLRSAGGALTIATGTNTGLNAGITLATAGTPRSIYFNGTATQLPNAAYNITIPAGISFGGTAVNVNVDDGSPANGYDNRARFVLQSGTTDAVYDVAANDTSPNLSDTGLDKDVWIGLSGTALVASGYTLRTTGSYQNDYRVVPIATTTQNNTVFTGAGKNLIVSTGVVPTDVNSSATDVLGSGFALTISAAQNYTGTTTVRGTVRNALMGGGVSGPTLAIAALGDLSGTTGITLDKSATMNIGGGPANYGRITAANVPITVKGGAILTDGSTNNNENVGVTDRIVTSADLTLGGDTGGGTFRMALPVSGIHAQTLDSLTVNAGYSAITNVNSGITANLTFSGGAKVTRSTGGVLAIANVTNYNIAFTAAPNATGMVSGGTYPILIGVVRGLLATEWVAAGAGGLASTTYVTNDYSSANNNVDATASANIAAGSTINSLRSTATATLTLAGNLTINSGGILMDPGAGNKAYSITGGTFRSGIDELIIFGNGGAGNALAISSQITGANPQNITLAGDNIRTTVTLSNASNSIGNIYIHGGGLIPSVAGALTTASTDTIYLFGGGLSMANSVTQNYTGRKLVVGAQGGTYSDGGAAAVSSLGGAVTLNGNLNVTGLGNKTLSGNIGTALGIEGGGQGTITAQTNAGRLTLSGNNQYWTGGLRVGNGMQVRLNHANAAGSGPLVNHSAIGIIEFTGNTDGARTVANDLVGSVSTSKTLISNAKTDAAVTLSGRLISAGGLTFQGYDNAGAVSETVLSGTLSISGIPDIYSYGDTSNLQRFVNGQGGINSGITKYQTTTALTYGTAGFLAYAGGTTTAVENGAEGYVRFSGANSFIPGAVGPGYLAALRKGGASALNYGYLLTAGSTYRLPQGKSFVLGTLGSGTAQVGTLGATGSGTANLDGGTKHEASTGQLLAGLYGGDINIHGNASGDTASLNLLTRDADTTLVLGNTSQVVFTPTWGDSGGQSCMTLMRHRSGNTTLRKTGLGTLVVKNTAYNQVSGVDARGAFTWQVDAGTLRYDQVDTGADYLGFNVNTGATLAGSGTINASVSVVSGTLNPGSATSPAALTMKSLMLNDSSAIVALDLTGDTAGTQYDQLVIPSGGDGVFLNNATLAIVLSYSPAVGKLFTIINRQSAGAVTGVFNGLAEGATVASTGITRNFTISYVGGDGNDVTLTAQ